MAEANRLISEVRTLEDAPAAGVDFSAFHDMQITLAKNAEFNIAAGTVINAGASHLFDWTGTQVSGDDSAYQIVDHPLFGGPSVASIFAGLHEVSLSIAADDSDVNGAGLEKCTVMFQGMSLLPVVSGHPLYNGGARYSWIWASSGLCVAGGYPDELLPGAIPAWSLRIRNDGAAPVTVGLIDFVTRPAVVDDGTTFTWPA